MDTKFLTLLILMHSLTMMSHCKAMKHSKNIETDTAALVALKAQITSDPLEFLSKNWSSASSVCDWIGVQCGHLHHRVTSLNISGMALRGTIPPHLGNLSFLVSLDMRGNYFHGTLPLELSGLRIIKFVRLASNNISGPVPTWFGPKLQVLSLYENDFSGIIPSSISNLSNLESLDLYGNLLTGNIPQEIGNLHSLRILDLGQNWFVGSIPSAIFNISTLETFGLAQNNLTGSLPYDIYLPSLKRLYLSNNHLNGEIPSSLSYCLQLQRLSLSYNNLSGSIPKQLGNLEMLERLYLGGNNLQGVIPREIGKLRKLQRFAIEHNNISGSIPKEIGNLTSGFIKGMNAKEIGNLHNFEVFDITENHISGSIPKEIGNLTMLAILSLGENHLTGTIPEEIGNLQELTTLSVRYDSLNGSIPIGIFNLSKLREIGLDGNFFTGTLPFDMGYRMPNLEIVQIQTTMLTGVIPASIGNCSKINSLALEQNRFSGPIPDSIGNLELLNYLLLSQNNLTIGLSLEHNQLIGAVPKTIQNLKNLQELYLKGNKLSGTLDKLCNVQRLGLLSLEENQVSESIPDCLGNNTFLRSLYLSYNLLTSSIPRSLWNLSDLMELLLASNSLSGSLPMAVGNLKALISMDLSMNQISGAIPSTLSGLQNLQNLSLAENQLEGSIPESVGGMLSLTSLNLSHNDLSGSIPKSLEKIRTLIVFDVSYNHLRGEIPVGGPFRNFTSESFIYNDALCGDPKFLVSHCKATHKHNLTTKKLLLLTLIPLAMAILVFLSLAYILWSHRRKNEIPRPTNVFDVATKERISYYELLRATDRYNDNNFLGSGSFGSVYKGILDDGKFVAVKVFNLQLEGSLKSFDVECKALCNLRHRNLVKVISSCSNQDFKALVLEYMSNGSLEKWLHSDNIFLNILQRLNIMIDVALGLQYLHQEYSTPVIHCDLKPSNVLIDEDFVAHVSDFGIAKFLSKDESFVLTKTLATIGYIAPEYGTEGLVSKACDVYSFGILLMEVFTGKRPHDEIFGENLNLKSWVNDCMPSIVEVIDANLINTNEEGQSYSNEMLLCLSSIMELALNCVQESPQERLNTSEVVNSLKKIKARYVEYHGGG